MIPAQRARIPWNVGASSRRGGWASETPAAEQTTLIATTRRANPDNLSHMQNLLTAASTGRRALQSAVRGGLVFTQCTAKLADQAHSSRTRKYSGKSAGHR
jgi:hypothetical protein